MSGFDKVIPSSISEYEIYDANTSDELEKVASANLDVPEGFVFDPDYLYMWVRIISAGEYYGPNKNGDYFPEQELLNYYETFKSAHVFKNHENKKVENAIGEIISVRWNPIMKCVEIFKGIDRKAAPEIVRGFLKGYLTDVSMGCKVPYTVCSVCGNKARRQNEFCDHVRKYRMEYLGGGERVFEINYEPKFHDSSAVLNGAERVAKALLIIDSPPEGTKATFKKIASSKGVSRYVKLTEQEIEKVASHNQELHPMLVEDDLEKLASDSFMNKIAELEKQVTGKLMNIVSAPENFKVDSAKQVLTIIKFLTEKRLGEDSLKNIAKTLKEVAGAEGVSHHQAFSTLLGVAELMGIELFPGELHTILSEMTDAKLVSDLEVSESEKGDVYPSEFAKGIKKTLAATEQLPEFNDPSSIFEMYSEGAHNKDYLSGNPIGFLESMIDHNDLDQQPSVRVVKVIRQTLEPLMASRSQHYSHLLPRLSVVLSGHKPIIGDVDARRDLEILSDPQTLGDVMATFAYKNYQSLRPKLKVTRLIKLAMYGDSALEKVAFSKDDYLGKAKEEMAYRKGAADKEKEMREAFKSQKKSDLAKGMKTRHAIALVVPAAYGASLFQKNRAEHGRNLSDAENFIADHPGIIAAGGIVGAKGLSKQIGKTIGEAGDFARNVKKKAKGTLKKNSSAREFEEITKLADAFPPGRFNAFDESFMVKFASVSGMEPKELVGLKVATLFSLGGMEKEAKEVMEYYEIPEQAKGMFLKEACSYVEGEMEKAANEFFNAMLLDTMVEKGSLTGTLPGRVVDGFVIQKVTDMINKNNEQNTKGLNNQKESVTNENIS